jgi:hypothetical protein
MRAQQPHCCCARMLGGTITHTAVSFIVIFGWLAVLAYLIFCHFHFLLDLLA